MVHPARRESYRASGSLQFRVYRYTAPTRLLLEARVRYRDMTAENRRSPSNFSRLGRRHTNAPDRSPGTHTTDQRISIQAPTEKVDGIAAVRGASTGFSVLLLGGMVTPLVAIMGPSLSIGWLPLVAVSAFVIAAFRVGDSSLPWLQGMMASVGSYLLVLPLVLIAPTGRNPIQVVLTFAIAILIGGLTGHCRGRPHQRRK